jgi:hypothetical protein
MPDLDINLLNDAKIYFSKLYKREVSEEEAESYLKSLVSLYDSFQK